MAWIWVTSTARGNAKITAEVVSIQSELRAKSLTQYDALVLLLNTEDVTDRTGEGNISESARNRSVNVSSASSSGRKSSADGISSIEADENWPERILGSIPKK